MKVYKIVFSPTGGTDRCADAVAQELADKLGAEVVTVDLSEQDFGGCSVERDAVAVIAMPSFGGRAPQTAVERLKKVTSDGARAVVIAVYGNREQEDTLLEIADTAKECGFRVIAGIAAVAEHSIAHQYAKGRPDADDIKQLKEFAAQIAEKLSKGDDTAPELPGNRPYKKAGSGLVPKGLATCTNCGVCVKKCPVGAIGRDDPKLTDKDKCINCMRCVAICTTGARTVNAMAVKVVSIALKKACSGRKDNILYK